MTITLTKTKLAIGVVAVALLAASTAWAATHPFNDVPKVGDPDERFYSEPVQWAWDNALTTGSPSGSDTFKPLDGVTRGENITFNFRYDQNVVQPALSDLTDDIDALEADEDADTVDGLDANDIARVAYDIDNDSVDNLTGNNEHDLSVTAPVDGVFVVTAQVVLGKDNSDETGTGYEVMSHRFLLDGVLRPDDAAEMPVDFDEALDTTLTNTTVIPVTAGDYTITGRLSGANATDVVFIYGRRIIAEFIPFGNDGMTAASLAPAAASAANENS